MKSDVKAILKKAFAAPEPAQKNDFLKIMEQPQISTFSFMLLQISYIRKRVWFVSAFITVLAMVSAGFADQDCIWIISAMIPFMALYAITESARSKTYGMAELEMTSRFSLKSIILARLGTIGLFHFLILCILISFVRKSAFVPFFQAGIYMLEPYLLTSVLGLIAVRKVHGKEAIYICMGISVIVSYLNLIMKEIIPWIYEEKQFFYWMIFVVYLWTRVWSEYKKVIYQTEELAWN